MKLLINPRSKSKTKARTKSKAVVGGKKKKPINKIKAVWLSSLALLLFLSVGYGGWSYFKINQLKAQAHDIPYIGGWGDLRAHACKETHRMYFGPVWKVRAQLWKQPNSTLSGSKVWGSYIRASAGAIPRPVAKSEHNNWFFGVVAGHEVWIPAFGQEYNSMMSMGVNTGRPSYIVATARPVRLLPNC